MSDERNEALVLADKLLDQPWADPDDDLRTLARQLLRREERIVQLENGLNGLIGMVQLFSMNGDIPFSIRRLMTGNHRFLDALACFQDVDWSEYGIAPCSTAQDPMFTGPMVDIPGEVHAPQGTVDAIAKAMNDALDATRCQNMAHKRYNMIGCTECSTAQREVKP